MAGGGAKALRTPEEELSSSSSGWSSENWESSEEGRTKWKDKVLPDGFLDPIPRQKSSKLQRFSNEMALTGAQGEPHNQGMVIKDIPHLASTNLCVDAARRTHRATHPDDEMSGRNTFRRAKNVVSRDGSSRESGTPTSVHPDSTCEQTQEENECSGTQQSPRHSSCEPTRTPNDGIWLIDEQGVPVRRRGRTTCIDIQNMPPYTRVHIEVNENNVPCNIPESVLLGSYLGVIARDPVLAPISFPDWRTKGMEPFKKKMLAEVESKFAFPEHIRHWILQSLGVKWRNHKTNLKAEHWDSRPIEEIIESIPSGVDAAQWCQLVSQWSQPKDKKRANINVANAKKQTCPHTMGRVSSIRRQQQMAIKDRLLLWRINRLHKDGTWSSEDAKKRWIQACELLAEDGLTPEDENVEANERVFNIVMGPEHQGRVRTQGFGVTPTRYFPHSTNEGRSSSGSSLSEIVNLREEVNSLRTEMREFIQQFRMQHPPQRSSQMGGNEISSEK